MKIIAIGDLHGRSDWKKIVSDNEFDKVVFMGDYFDTHENITPEQQKTNFEEIIKYKKENGGKVVLLIGNHDFHYMKNVNQRYSGFQEFHAFDISEMLEKALSQNLIQACFIYDKYLFTHAGVTKTWLNCNTRYTGEEPLDLFINDLFKFQPSAFNFTKGVSCSPYGDDICQTPIWVRPKSLLKDLLNDFIQVVGHTAQENIKILKDKIILIDTIGTSGEYLIIENKTKTIKTLI